MSLKPREDGIFILTDPEKDGEVQMRTFQCVHCGRHWGVGEALELASKDEMGLCQRCDGVTCPGPCSEKCVPMEQRLENWEAGIDPEFVPIVSKPGTLPVDVAKLPEKKLILPGD